MPPAKLKTTSQKREDRSKPGAGGLHPIFLLAGALFLTFSPMLFGKNFLPFERYPFFTAGFVEGSGQSLRFDEQFLDRGKKNPWLYELEPAWFTLQLPQEIFAAREWRRGRVPLWDPFTGCGTPTLDTGHFRPFNVFRAPFYLVPNIWSYCLSLLIGLIAGAAGAYLWLSKIGLSSAASAFGAAVFTINPMALERLALPDSAAYFLLPWCLLALSLTDLRGWKSAAVAAVPFVLMGHAGHPEACLLMALASAIFYLWHGGAPDAFPGRALLLSRTGVLVLACLAALWLPIFKMRSLSFSYKDLASSLVVSSDWRSFFHCSADMYLAPAITCFAVAALVSGRFKGAFVAWVTIALVFLAPLPFVGHAFADLLFSSTGFVYFYFKWLFWAGTSFLAASGFEAVRQGDNRALSAGIAAGAISILTSLAVQSSAALVQPFKGVSPSWALALVAAAFVCMVAAIIFWGRRASSLLISTAILPLFFPLSLSFLTWNGIRLLPEKTVERISSDAPHDRVVSIGTRPSFAIAPNWGQARRVRGVEMTSPFFLNGYYNQFHTQGGVPTFVMFGDLDLPQFSRMGASLLLVPNAHVPRGLSRVFEGPWSTAYAIPGAPGRLTITSDGASPPGEAEFLSDDIHEIEIETRAGQQSTMVLRDTWYPGWEAFVDGAPTDIKLAEGCFRSVAVPAGKHTVTFLYSPQLLYWAGGTSLLCTFSILALALWPRRTTGQVTA